jgi:predicted oxidoreductase
MGAAFRPFHLLRFHKPCADDLIYCRLGHGCGDRLPMTIAISIVGVVVNRQAQVLQHATHQPIPGLYACGNMVATDRWPGVGYQAGCQLMGAAILGALAAEHAANATT